ncbi:MAG TPA: C40 family peptidase [Cytophagales bacterium]|nr:C40 family peptidase [Cytophagales bacterium]
MIKGISIYNVIPQRAEGSNKSEMVNQLLFGDIYEILSVSPDQKWLQIKTLYDNYEGFIDAKLHHAIEDYNPNAITQEVCILKDELRKIYIPAGCFLQLHADGSRIHILDTIFNITGTVDHLHTNPSYTRLKNNAYKFLGTPYLWGGKSNFGIDCSGFVQQVFKMSGIQLLRDAYQQATQGTEVLFEERQAGDLAFFGESGKITHVGLLLEHDEIIHAHGEVRIDSLDQHGILNKKINAYSHALLKINRIFSKE